MSITRKRMGIIFAIIVGTFLGIVGLCTLQEKVPTVGVVISSKSSTKESHIRTYDSSLNLYKSKGYEYFNLGDIYYEPVTFSNTLYLVSQKNQNSKGVVSVDPKTLEDKKVDIDEPGINSIEIYNDNVYFCNTINGVSHIYKKNITNKKQIQYELPQIYLTKLKYYKNKLYAFGTSIFKHPIAADLYVFNSKLELIEKIDISNHGIMQYKVITVGEKLFFSNQRNNKDEIKNTVSMYDVKTKVIDSVSVPNNPSSLSLHDKHLVIAHFNLTNGKGRSITLYNLVSGVRKTYDLPHGVRQITSSVDGIFIIDENNLYKYTIEKSKLVMVKKEKIIDNAKTYLSGVFAVETH